MVETPGDRLAALRSRARLSAKGLGLVSGLSASTVALIESNKRKGKGFAALQKLSVVLGATVEYLANGAGRPPSDRVLARAVAAAVEAKNRELARADKLPIEFLRSA
jgi:transcriptional regulator with XRE-family HTH domain